jgi:release factor glutamine methyltransferase
VAARLRAAGCVFAEDEAHLLLVEAATPAALEAMVARRVSGEPLEYILGWAEFCGMRISVTPGVFVPRRRSEALVREAARLLRPGAGGDAVAPYRVAAYSVAVDPVVIDLCCGSGAIAAALLARVPSAKVYACDFDPMAVECARTNLEPLGGRVFAGDLFVALPPGLLGRASVIAANAPYVPTGEIGLMPPEARDHERRISLDGGPDGTDLHRRIAADAPQWLAPGGHLLIETGRAQAEAAARHMTAAGFAVSIVEDDELDATVVVGRLA